MSERDLKRIQVLTEVLAGRRTVVSAAATLALGVRQTFRLLARYQAAIVENKRLRHALTIIKAQQDTKCQPKVQTNSEKGGYRKTPRKIYGLPEEKLDSPPARKAVEMTA